MRLSALGFMLTFALGLLWTPLVATAQPVGHVWRIGVLNAGAASSAPSLAARQQSPFWQAMHELGWVEGQNVTVEPRYAEGHTERLQGLATELVQLPVDVIVTIGAHEARAAKAASDTIPIVFVSVGDPVRFGLVASLAHPGGNVTGLSIVSPELSVKRLALLKDAVPGISRVAVLTNADVNYLLPEITRTAQQVGVTVSPINVPTADQLDQAFAALTAARAEALLVLSAPLFSQQMQRVVELVAASRVPTLYPFRNYVVAGGLMSYGPRLADLPRRAAYYVDRILKGTKPADLPVEQPTTFELVINLKTAEALGIPVPPLVLFQADEVLR
jgi:putative tryptophan/tyrosine transport system substrate-binding protein